MTELINNSPPSLLIDSLDGNTNIENGRIIGARTR